MAGCLNTHWHYMPYTSAVTFCGGLGYATHDMEKVTCMACKAMYKLAVVTEEAENLMDTFERVRAENERGGVCWNMDAVQSMDLRIAMLHAALAVPLKKNTHSDPAA